MSPIERKILLTEVDKHKSKKSSDVTGADDDSESDVESASKCLFSLYACMLLAII